MSKVTTIIDIGSNSMRMVVLQKSSRFSFSLINETKSRVKISEGCYENNGNLQDIPMQRAYESLKSFLNISHALKSRKIICVATSALRDAPNSKVFISRVQKELGLNIKVIEGEKEAYYGGVAALNLLHDNTFITMDIGGGSTELTYYENGKMKYEHSFNIGTIRLLNNLVTKENWEEMKTEIKTKIVSKKPMVAIGSGGNINKIFSMSKTKDGKPMSANMLKTFYKDLKELTVEERMLKHNLREDRADVIVPALEIFNKVLNWAEISQIFVPKISVADGLIHSIYDKVKK